MRFFAALILTLGLSAPALAQPNIIEAGVTLTRDVDATGVGPVHGLSLDDETRDAFFIGDGGNDLFRLSTDGTVTQIADDVGRFIGILSDLRVGPDGLIYVGDSFLAGGETDGDIFRFERDGTFVDTFASVLIGAGSNAFGMDFDCAGDLYASETGDNLYRIDPMGTVSIHSNGWVDVDEIERGENNQMFVLDGSARSDEHGTVFLHEPDGSLRRYAEGLPRIHAATFDRGSGDLIVGTYTTGEVLRLRDTSGDGVIQPEEVTTIADGFAANALVDVDYGRASSGDGYALYLVASGHIYELGGFGAPRFGGCGALFDDDGDGVCDMGVDTNGDGDCNDVGEDTDAMDCDDSEPLSSPLLSEVCNDGIDNDCDGDVDLGDDMCATFDTDMDGIPDIVEIPNGDSDMDGDDDFEDPDDDNDGIPTIEECPDPADCRDTDGTEGVDYLDPDDDGDGVLTMDERPMNADQNTDEDGIPDHLDPDDDGDGIPTATEIADVLDLGGEPDDDGIPAYLDTDSDGDMVDDETEGRGDLDGDGELDYLDADSSPRDTDMDGIRDDVECPGAVMPCPDTDEDGTPDFEDPDDDGDGIPTRDERPMGDQDTDADDVPDHLDADDDGDGVPTATECMGGLPCMNTDSDDNPDYLDPDDDNDGIETATEIADEAALGGNVDGDDIPAYLDTDSDDDGVGDEFEGRDDDDGDGAPNYLDADSVPDDMDGDGVPDSVECSTEPCIDSDGDGTPDLLDPDDDGDGIPTQDERPMGMSVDTDDNGVADYLDPDDDGDTVPTRDERPDDADRDSDMDGTPDHLDDDDDDDGILTSVENNAAEGLDVDGDGIPNYLDENSDGDSRSDAEEGTGDDDMDGTPNYLDPDGTVPTSGGGVSGGGCSASGGSTGSTWLLLMTALFWRRRRS